MLGRSLWWRTLAKDFNFTSVTKKSPAYAIGESFSWAEGGLSRERGERECLGTNKSEPKASHVNFEQCGGDKPCLCEWEFGLEIGADGLSGDAEGSKSGGKGFSETMKGVDSFGLDKFYVAQERGIIGVVGERKGGGVLLPMERPRV